MTLLKRVITTNMAEKLDVIIFGASGFTGKYTVFEAVSVLNGLRWGVAGRNRSKLESTLKDMGIKANTNLMNIPIITADIENESSLVDMANKCRVLINCCGPFRFFGEQVVKACIEAGTHHIDVSGENQYMETMQLKYHEKAQEKNCYVVSACGFDSIPSEMGVNFVEKNFDGTVNSVETYLQTYHKGGKPSGAGIHYGTFESAVHAIANLSELRDIRSKLFKERLPKFQPILKPRPLMFRSEVVNGVCLPFPGPDRDVVRRSQYFFYNHEKKRPIQMNAYIAFRTWTAATLVAFFAVIFGVMAKFQFTRQFMLKYPKIVSFGYISHEGPSEATMERVRFAMTLKACGWPKSEKLSEPTDQFKDPPTKTLTAKVTGPNPGYGSTCVALLACAKTILKESDKMPSTGGVYPPGAAFAKTSLISELEKHDHGMKFEILANK